MCKLVNGEKFQVHMQERRSIEADEQPWLSNVIPGEGSQQGSQVSCQLAGRAQHLFDDVCVGYDDQVQVRVLVELPGDE